MNEFETRVDQFTEKYFTTDGKINTSMSDKDTETLLIGLEPSLLDYPVTLGHLVIEITKFMLPYRVRFEFCEQPVLLGRTVVWSC